MIKLIKRIPGIFLIDGLTIIFGLVLGLIMSGYFYLIFMVSMTVGILFNLFIASTNNVENVKSKFRKWLFGN